MSGYTTQDLERLVEAATLSRGTIQALNEAGVNRDYFFVVPNDFYPDLRTLGGLRVVHADVKDVCLGVPSVVLP